MPAILLGLIILVIGTVLKNKTIMLIGLMIAVAAGIFTYIWTSGNS